MSKIKAELIKENCFSPRMEQFVQLTINSIDRFMTTIEDLTNISKLQKDLEGNPTEEIINIQEVFDDIIEDLSYSTEIEACAISADFQVHQLKFSRKNFRSILYNLISAAIKYQSTERACVIHLYT